MKLELTVDEVGTYHPETMIRFEVEDDESYMYVTFHISPREAFYLIEQLKNFPCVVNAAYKETVANGKQNG